MQAYLAQLHHQEQLLGISDNKRSYALTHSHTPRSAIIAIHGCLADPRDTRSIAEQLFKNSHCDVLGIRLAGHGQTASDLSCIHYQQWLSELNTACVTLKPYYHYIYLYGVSMGALLALYIAATISIDALVLISPMYTPENLKLRRLQQLGPWAYALIQHYFPKRYFPTNPTLERRTIIYDRISMHTLIELLRLIRSIKKQLHHVKIPTLIMHSPHDTVANLKSAQYIFNNIASHDKQLLWTNGSHTFLFELTEDTHSIVDTICQFYRGPVHYFQNLAEKTP